MKAQKLYTKGKFVIPQHVSTAFDQHQVISFKKKSVTSFMYYTTQISYGS